MLPGLCIQSLSADRADSVHDFDNVVDVLWTQPAQTFLVHGHVETDAAIVLARRGNQGDIHKVVVRINQGVQETVHHVGNGDGDVREGNVYGTERPLIWQTCAFQRGDDLSGDAGALVSQSQKVMQIVRTRPLVVYTGN